MRSFVVKQSDISEGAIGGGIDKNSAAELCGVLLKADVLRYFFKLEGSTRPQIDGTSPEGTVIPEGDLVEEDGGTVDVKRGAVVMVIIRAFFGFIKGSRIKEGYIAEDDISFAERRGAEVRFGDDKQSADGDVGMFGDGRESLRFGGEVWVATADDVATVFDDKRCTVLTGGVSTFLEEEVVIFLQVINGVAEGSGQSRVSPVGSG